MYNLWGFPSGSDGKESACNVGDLGSILWLGLVPNPRREWLPTPVFLPGESHEQRNLVGYSLWGCRESDTTELLSMHAQTPKMLTTVEGNTLLYTAKGTLQIWLRLSRWGDCLKFSGSESEEVM